MGRKSKTFSILTCAAIFIVLEIAALAMLKRSSTLQNIWLNRASHRIVAMLWSNWDNVQSYFSLNKTNKDLLKRNELLNKELYFAKSRIAEYEKVRTGQELSDTLAERYKGNFIYVPARIVKMSLHQTRNHFIIDKGYEDGISPHSGVISDKGIVGIIYAVSRNYSYGLSLMNSNITISSKLKKSSITAPMNWDGLHSDRAVVSDIPPHREVAAGDTVLTSGFSAFFPEGIPVGITGASKLVDGTNKHVEVKLFQDLKNLHYVTVTINRDLEEITELEYEAITQEGGKI